MDLVYISEDGHCFSNEEFYSYVIWKMQDLKEQHFSQEEIINFDDSKMWNYRTNKLLTNKFSNCESK